MAWWQICDWIERSWRLNQRLIILIQTRILERKLEGSRILRRKKNNYFFMEHKVQFSDSWKKIMQISKSRKHIRPNKNNISFMVLKRRKMRIKRGYIFCNHQHGRSLSSCSKPNHFLGFEFVEGEIFASVFSYYILIPLLFIPVWQICVTVINSYGKRVDKIFVVQKLYTLPVYSLDHFVKWATTYIGSQMKTNPW